MSLVRHVAGGTRWQRSGPCLKSRTPKNSSVFLGFPSGSLYLNLIEKEIKNIVIPAKCTTNLCKMFFKKYSNSATIHKKMLVRRPFSDQLWVDGWPSPSKYVPHSAEHRSARFLYRYRASASAAGPRPFGRNHLLFQSNPLVSRVEKCAWNGFLVLLPRKKKTVPAPQTHPHPQPPSDNGGSDTPRHLERVARLGGEDLGVM